MQVVSRYIVIKIVQGMSTSNIVTKCFFSNQTTMGLVEGSEAPDNEQMGSFYEAADNFDQHKSQNGVLYGSDVSGLLVCQFDVTYGEGASLYLTPTGVRKLTITALCYKTKQYV